MLLQRYLERIGYLGSRQPTRAALAEIALRHACSIPFENIDAYLGTGVSLDPQAVARKLVGSARGGWCFEQNLLLGDALRALGFDVTDLAARVMWNRPPDVAAARTHRLLCVRLDGRQWLADAGFGGHTLTTALEMDSEAAQSTSHEPFRLRRQGQERVLESLVSEEWRSLCRFDMQPQLPVDFEAPNYQLAHDPASPFTQRLVVSRVTLQGRHVLRGDELVFHPLDGGTRRERLGNSDALLETLREVFGIEPPDQAALAAKFDAQIASAARS